MADQPPKTPPPLPDRKTDAESENTDTFDDSTDLTPKPRSKSPSATRSLTDRRTSAASIDKDKKESISNGQDKPKVEDKGEASPEAAGKDVSKENANVHLSTERAIPVNRISIGGMDDVNLGEVTTGSQSPRTRSPTRASVASISSVKNSTVDLSHTPPRPTQSDPPPLKIPPSSSATMSPDKSFASTISTNAANAARRFNSPFSWLSRAATNDKKVASPPVTSPPGNGYPHRRSDAAFSRADSDEGSSNGRNSIASLKDRFKQVRMREEAGITAVGEESVVEDFGSPVSNSNEVEGAEVKSPISRKSSIAHNDTVNPSLPPGTAAGHAEAPRSDEPVDWDFWQVLVSEGPAAVQRSSPEEMREAISKGIPQAIRGVIWQVLAESKNDELEAFYRELVARGTDKDKAPNGYTDANGNPKERASVASSASSVHSEMSTPAPGTPNPDSPSVSTDGFTNPLTPKPKTPKEEIAHIKVLEKTIRRDLGTRTSFSKFLTAKELQEPLFGVCKAYALYDEEVGYAQGMNFVAMPLLFNVREEEAFCLFVRLMSKYGLRDFFTQDMPGLHLHLYYFERLLEDYEPALYCHLHRRGVGPDLYACQWFLTLFAYRFPLQLVQRIYDIVLHDGLTLLLKVALVLMQRNRDAILGMKDMAQLNQFLQTKIFDVYIDNSPSNNSILESGFFGSTGGIDKAIYKADQLVQEACAVEITPDQLKQFKSEWDEKQRTEKETKEADETLRRDNATMAVKIRKLESHIESADSEHVEIASELVRLKVANGNLEDENESLKGQVTELKAVVDTQAEEVENKLRGEMEEVMKKNLEVHNVNRALEEEKAEMESEFAETKLQYALVKEELEALKKRWNNIAQLMKPQS